MCAVFPAHHLVPLVPTSISLHTPNAYVPNTCTTSLDPLLVFASTLWRFQACSIRINYITKTEFPTLILVRMVIGWSEPFTKAVTSIWMTSVPFSLPDERTRQTFKTSRLSPLRLPSGGC